MRRAQVRELSQVVVVRTDPVPCHVAVGDHGHREVEDIRGLCGSCSMDVWSPAARPAHRVARMEAAARKGSVEYPFNEGLASWVPLVTSTGPPTVPSNN